LPAGVLAVLRFDPGGNFAVESLMDEPIELVRVGLKAAVLGRHTLALTCGPAWRASSAL